MGTVVFIHARDEVQARMGRESAISGGWQDVIGWAIEAADLIEVRVDLLDQTTLGVTIGATQGVDPDDDNIALECEVVAAGLAERTDQRPSGRVPADAVSELRGGMRTARLELPEVWLRQRTVSASASS